jgi:hypothetical protein
MGIKKTSEKMNYNFATKGSELYNIIYELVEDNSEILDMNFVEKQLLPPNAFGDGRKREGYERLKQLIEIKKQEKIENNNYERGMAK